MVVSVGLDPEFKNGPLASGHLKAMQDTPPDDATIRHLVDWAEADEGIRAVILTSSRATARGPRDLLSDYDVIVVVDDLQPYFDDRTWLEAFGTVLVVYRDPIQQERGCRRFAYITQYEDGTKIDFTLWPCELMHRVAKAPTLSDELDVGYAVLVDKDGLTRELKPATQRAHIPGPPSAASFHNVVQEFFQEATYVAKHLWRRDLMPAKYNLDHAMKQVNLRTMLEWRIEIDHDWSVRPGSYGAGLEQMLPREEWAELESTYVGAGIDENWQALFDTIVLFRRVATGVATQLDYTYPNDLDERVLTYLQMVKSLPYDADSFPA